MYIITRSLSTHFGGNLGYDSLKSAIKNAITTQFLAIQSYGDTVEFYFANTLSSPEQTTFDDIISNYVYTPDAKPKKSSISLTPKTTSVNNTSYSNILTFKYLGTLISGAINYIEVVSYRDPAVTSYDIRVVNHDTGAVIASRTGLTNTDYVANDLGAITNVPAVESTLDLQVRKTGGPSNKYVYVDSLIIYN